LDAAHNWYRVWQREGGRVEAAAAGRKPSSRSAAGPVKEELARVRLPMVCHHPLDIARIAALIKKVTG